MAEVAAGALVAEQIVSTTAEAGAATYAVAQPTMPLRATFYQIATSLGDNTDDSLERSNHSLTVIGERVYIFGGVTTDDKLAGNNMHSFALGPSNKSESDYQMALPTPVNEGGPVPDARRDHAACSFQNHVAICGGADASGKPLDSSTIWLFNPVQSCWDTIEPSPSAKGPDPRKGSKLFAQNHNLILYGGKGSNDVGINEVWKFDTFTKVWSRLPDAPVATSNATITNGSLYLIEGIDLLSSNIHHFNLSKINDNAFGTSTSSPTTWKTEQFPTNALVPGPRPREEGGLLMISTGFGRNYLLYFFGNCENVSNSSPLTAEEEAKQLTQWGDMWTYQLPSNDMGMRMSLSFADAIQPAKLKDAIRSTFGADPGTGTWGEVYVQPPGDLNAHAGKVHPGPRSSFGFDIMGDGKSVVLWGGVNAKGEKEGDGWVVKLE